MTIDHDALVRAARVFVANHTPKCNITVSGCDRKATTVLSYHRGYFACDLHTAGERPGLWQDLPQAALVRLLAEEP